MNSSRQFFGPSVATGKRTVDSGVKNEKDITHKSE